MPEKIIIFDTTLRDGEQSPGASMNVEEKLKVAKQLEKLNVDVIEAGFPASSEGELEAVRAIAQEVHGPQICALARANRDDIDKAWKAIKGADEPRIHTFIATSDIHLKYKLRMSREQVLEALTDAVSYAKKFTDNVEFSPEDATRTDLDFLCQVVEAAIEAGATTVNIPDTVGYSVPSEFGRIIRTLKERVTNIDEAVLSVHCHNDLGLAVANSLAAIQNGARQVECTINGIGERAGNASLEEIAMILRVRKDILPYYTELNTEQIYPTSRLVSTITGMAVQPNKAIVGANAFAHEAGIHQDGILKEKLTYEIMTPETVGIPRSHLVLGKHSGRHAFRERLRELGYELGGAELDRVFQRFKKVADRKKVVYDEDIIALVEDEIFRAPDKYKLLNLNVQSGTVTIPTATVQMEVDGKFVQEAGFGNGPVDAAFKTIQKIVRFKGTLLNFSVASITGGTDAQGEVTVKIEEDGYTAIGQGAHTDIIIASAKAFVNALNKLSHLKERRRAGRG
ncbi:MAG: 2-isopropylmalate synthase [Deltaproteobacteria bacterium]|nr:MAG: 2-isopropylmalate synthase [Deltaproteobacteria bacterium]RLA95765.1 MAG: 2-isopropylmalate synthase [Deltaproteobacteria bacterium]